jgi:IclR family acetate operon transcriptional repressor
MSGPVQSLTRALGVLRTIAAAEDGLILRDVARASALPVSTAHRLLMTLEGEGWVRANPETGAWMIGAEAFRVGAGFLRTRDIGAFARPRLKALAQRWSETASLYVESEGRLTCLAQVESRQMVRAVTRVGGTVPLHGSGAGKAWLAALSNEAAGSLLTGEFVRYTRHTLGTAAAVLAALPAVRAQGFAVDDEELVEGVRCAAAVVRDHTGAPVAALSVSGPSARLDGAALTALGRGVAEAAQALSRDLGHAGR